MLKADLEEKLEKRKPPTPASKNEIVLRRIGELEADPRNSVEHGKDNLDRIRQSLRLYGQVEPLTLQRGTNRVVGGHGRILVMLEDGWEWAECIERDLTDAEATDLNIRLNSAPKLSTWNTENLAAIMQDGDVDLANIFGGEELSQILTGIVSGDGEQEGFLSSLAGFEESASAFIDGFAEGERKGKGSARGGNYQSEKYPSEKYPSGELPGKRIACPFCGEQWQER